MSTDNSYIQANNTTVNHKYLVDGEWITTREASEKYNLPYERLRGRISAGYDLQEAIYNEFSKVKYNLTYNGETHSIPEWSKITGIKTITIRGRLRRGWSVDKTLSTPVKTNSRWK